MPSRTLALDIGEKRIGVAISDASGRVATPLVVLDAKATFRDGGKLPGLIDEYDVKAVLVGLPLSLDGLENEQSRRVRSVVDRLAQFLPVQVEYADERLSTAEAARRAREFGLDARSMRGKLDAVAASIVLQAWLDGRSKEGAGGEI